MTVDNNYKLDIESILLDSSRKMLHHHIRKKCR
jgi:hypothetical protein